MKKLKPLKIRKSWGTMSPVTKVKQSAKRYSRAKNKRSNEYGE